METILVVDDDPHIREVVSYALNKAHFQTIEAVDGHQAIKCLRENPLDLVILDIGMPEMDGIEACTEIRKFSSVPIIFLTVQREEIDQLLALKIGGDDYITKPFRVKSLMARVKTQLRHAKRSADQIENGQPVSSDLLTHGDLRVDLERVAVYCGDKEIELTPTQFGIFKTLMSRPEKVFTRDEIMDRAYKHTNHVVTERNIDGHVSGVRKAFGKNGCEDPIKTIHGVGFKLKNLSGKKKR